MAALLEGTVNAALALGDLALNPAITASALAFLAYGPSHLVAGAVGSEFIERHVGLHGLKVALGVLVGLGVARYLNLLQNTRASNNWRLSGRARGWVWDREIAVVTGGCNGIGRALVLGLARRGVRVAALDVADPPPEFAGLEAVSYWKCDVADPAAVAEAADGIRARLGHPSVLVNNAGVTRRVSISDSTPGDVAGVFGVNVLSHWYTVGAFLGDMVAKNKGHVVTVASIASFATMSSAVAYSASKAAVLSFHEGLACEIRNVHGAPGVLTTVVHPMFVNTDMIRSPKKKEEGDSAIQRRRRDILEPEEVADAVLRQIFSCRGAQLFLPSRVWWVSGFRGFPNWVQEAIRDVVARPAFARPPR